jgi:UTP-glucose-1-phosphate uridylyltransferase
MDPSLVILAAGMGSRYGGLKQVDAFGPHGETIIDYSIYDAINAGFKKIVFIIREKFSENFEKIFKEKLGDKVEIEFVYQELDKVPEGSKYPEDRTKPWGTAHAVIVAKEVVKEPFAIINADDYYGVSAYKLLYNFLTNPENIDKNNYCIIGYYLKNTLSEYGTVNRGVCSVDADENLKDIVETLKIKREEDGIVRYPTEEGHGELSEDVVVSMNMFGFMPSYFDYAESMFKKFLEERAYEEKSEFYIPEVLDDMQAKEFAKVKVLNSDSNWFGVTYKDDKPYVVHQLNHLISIGVYPENLWDI